MQTQQKVRHLDAAEFIAAVLDPGSYRSWDAPVNDPDPRPRVPAGTGHGPGQDRR